MKLKDFLLLPVIVLLSSIGAAVAQKSDMSLSKDSTNRSSLHEGLSLLGGDFILDGEIHELHFIKNAISSDVGTGLGLEIRVHPFFLGAIVGLSGNLGMPYLPQAGFYYSTLTLV